MGFTDYTSKTHIFGFENTEMNILNNKENKLGRIVDVMYNHYKPNLVKYTVALWLLPYKKVKSKSKSAIHPEPKQLELSTSEPEHTPKLKPKVQQKRQSKGKKISTHQSKTNVIKVHPKR